MVMVMSTAPRSLHGRLAADGERVVCAHEPVTGMFRIGLLAVSACLFAIVPTILDNFAGSSRDLTIMKVVGYGMAAVGVVAAVTLRGREISVERGAIIIRRLRAPLRPEGETRIPAAAIRDVSMRAVTVSDDILSSARRYVVSANLSGRPSRVRLLTVRDEALAVAATTQIRDAVRASAGIGLRDAGLGPRLTRR